MNPVTLNGPSLQPNRARYTSLGVVSTPFCNIPPAGWMF